MAYTDADLVTLRAHIASGVQSVRYSDGRQVNYHSLDEMLKAEQHIVGVIARAAPGARPRRRTPVFRNGL